MKDIINAGLYAKQDRPGQPICRYPDEMEPIGIFVNRREKLYNLGGYSFHKKVWSYIDNNINHREIAMNKSVYKVIEVVGSSPDSWEDAANFAIEQVNKSVRNLRIAEVVEQDIKIEDGKPVGFRIKLRLSFKYEL